MGSFSICCTFSQNVQPETEDKGLRMGAPLHVEMLQNDYSDEPQSVQNVATLSENEVVIRHI